MSLDLLLIAVTFVGDSFSFELDIVNKWIRMVLKTE